jgi:hypothetical protein
MDCEKFESAMMDELYGELDELTSAAVKRHVTGCARCSALIGGFRATRRLAALPVIEPPAALEERILRAASEARPVLPAGRRLARAVSLAGNWAMRPQTAMAAVFLVMFGTSVLLLRGKSSRAPASASITVTEEGTPAPVACAAPPEPMAVPPTMASSRQPSTQRPTEAKPVVAAATVSPTDSPLGAARSRSAAKAVAAAAEDRDLERLDSPASEAAAAGMANAAPAPAEAPGAGAAGAPAAAYASPPQRAFATAPAPTNPQQSFAAALSAYRAGRFDDAFQTFDALSTNDPMADLYSARSLRQGKGCRASLDRFDRVAMRAPGSPPGWDALLEGAYCYASVGNVEQARNNLIRLRSVDSHRDRAQKELDRLAGLRPPSASPPPASPPADRSN